MPVEGLIYWLQDAGFSLIRHPSLLQEVSSITRDLSDPKIVAILGNDSILADSIQNFKLPLINCPESLEGKVFMWVDFADLVLSDINDHNKMGDLVNPNTI